jgi:N-formylglutamate amidohydrolase
MLSKKLAHCYSSTARVQFMMITQKQQKKQKAHKPMPELPDWVVFHVPHDADNVPDTIRDQFLLDNDQLAQELLLMTDHFTLKVFCEGTNPQNIVRAPVSRLVVDVERFLPDEAEPMSAKGMGAIYTQTADGRPLRRELSPPERQMLLESYYAPHHERLERLVDEKINMFGQCLVIDCHSFPSAPLPYEGTRDDAIRPDICIGTDPFHTPSQLASNFVGHFSNSVFTVALNDPFSGALVPMSRYRKDLRVQAIMVEVNRKLYMDETTGEETGSMPEIIKTVRDNIRRCL